MLTLHQMAKYYAVNSATGIARIVGKGKRIPLRFTDLLSGFERRTVPCGRTYDAGDVHGECTLYLQSDGTCSFFGHVHDTGKLIGDDYTFSAAPIWKGPKGEWLLFSHSGKLGAALPGTPARDDQWQDDSYNALIADNWDEIKDAKVHFVLHQSPDGLQIWKEIAAAIVVAGVLVEAAKAIPVLFAVLSGHGSCGVGPQSDPFGEGNGTTFVCKKNNTSND